MSSPSSHWRLIALIVACAFFMQGLDSAIINTSLPQMARSFAVRPLDLSVGITVYMLALAACVPLSGWLADRHGARNVFLTAIVVFTAASLACGLSQNLWQFSVARAVQGLGGALMTPVGRMVVLRHAQKSELIQATALMTWPALLAPVIGPALGGFITTYIHWRWNFLLNVPLGLLGLALVYAFVPNQREARRAPLDRRGFVLTALALVSLLYGLEAFAHARADWQWPLALIGIGALLTLLSVRHLRRAPHPLLDLTAFRVQTFAYSSLWAGSFFRMAINATPFLLPLLFQVGFGLSPLQSGMLIFAYFIGNLGMKTVTTPTLQRFGFRRVLVVNGLLGGMSIIACGFLTPDTPQWAMAAVLLAAGLTRSMQFTALNTLAFADIPAAQRGSASTLSSMLQQVSMVLGVALSAFVLNVAQWRHGGTVLTLADFRVAFIVVGGVGLLAAWRFLQLPRDAGDELVGKPLSRAST
jgi:EmrB/QacA subfamily drug resistance transporter